jgi:hypothetical protein
MALQINAKRAGVNHVGPLESLDKRSSKEFIVSAASEKNLVVLCHWNVDGNKAKERIPIDLDDLSKNPKGWIETTEVWSEGRRVVYYKPRVTYKRDSKGAHVLTLVYDPKEHSYLKNLGIIWGVNTLRISKDLSAIEGDWQSNPSNSGDSGWHGPELVNMQSSQRRRKAVLVRDHQGKFKRALLDYDKKCVLTGATLPALLEAAHIQEVRDGGSDDVGNGLLLRVDLHRLFDARLFSINVDGTLALHSGLPNGYKLLLSKLRIRDRAILVRIRASLSKRNLQF